MARRHIGFGLSGLFLVFLAILMFVPKQISGFDDISITLQPPDSPPDLPTPADFTTPPALPDSTASPASKLKPKPKPKSKPKSKPQKQSKI